ncbi:MAG: methyltransferase domain-containing protein [Thermoplasmata archaeon]|nr:MAG: methyltransferase domain-containing protein [Thermoplasmata archaeon]
MEKKKSFDYVEDHYFKLKDQEEDFRNNNLTDLLLTYLKGGTVLDIGCGVGYFLSKAEKRCSKAYGIEPNKNLSRFIRKEFNSSVIIFEIWAQELDTLKEKFDNITMIDVLEHIEEDEEHIRTIFNQLNDKGRFILVVPAHKILFGIRDKKAGHYRRYAKYELITKLQKNGFNIMKIRHWNMIGFFPYYGTEKILHKELSSRIRFDKEKGTVRKILNSFFNLWFKCIENNVNFHFGLSLIVVAEKSNNLKKTKTIIRGKED